MDYIFYRIHKYYSKKKDDTAFITTVGFLFVVKLAIIFFLWTFFNSLTGGFLSKKNPDFNEVLFKIVVYSIFLLLYILDLIRYLKRGKIKDLERKYKNDKRNIIIRTWQIFVIPILILSVSFLYIVIVY